MLSYELSDGERTPLYEQLYRCIRADIHRGELRAGDKLPSRRSLADHLGVSQVTVDSAYAQLLSEGYIHAEPRRGYFVSTTMEAESLRLIRTAPLRPAEQEPRRAWLADFTSNETRPEQFPFAVWSRLIREQLSLNRDDLMRNPPPAGRMDLRQAIAEHLRSFRGLDTEPERIIIGAGTEYLYGLLVQLLGRDRIFCSEDPGYGKPAMVYAAHGARCRFAGMDEEGIRVGELPEEGPAAVHVSPSHHFPTGRVMSAGRRWELLNWAAAGDRYIIEDDYDSEFRLTGLPIPALQSMDSRGRVIYMNTFTKTLASTIRISYMVLPPELLTLYRERLAFYSCTVSSIEQATLAAFIARGSFEKHLNRTRSSFRRKRDLLLEGIRARIPESMASVAEEDAGLHFLLTLRTSLRDEAVRGMAERLGLRIAPLSGFYRNGNGPAHCFVINYSSLREEDIGRVCAALEELAREAAK